MAKRIGKSTILLERPVGITGTGSVVGKTEHEGPLAREFDTFSSDSRFGEASFEKAESRLQQIALDTALSHADLRPMQVDCVFAGDLLNQCIGSSFGLRDFGIPVAGLYGACSTMTLGLCLAAIAVESGAARVAAAVTSSHFCSAERQYRFPLEYGCQRTPSAQWTVTGAGAAVLRPTLHAPQIVRCCVGRIVDCGITDANNMGAAMAPSAADTLLQFFEDTDTAPQDYDLIFTGDLGKIGSELLYTLTENRGCALRGRHNDCGLMIYDCDRQDVHAGGSGCGCSAAVFASYVMHRLQEKALRNILFCSTGALMSPTSALQGESIPGVTHLIQVKCD